MHKIGALLLAAVRSAKSYRLRMALSIGALAITVLPMWYAANALQSVMAGKIRGEGTQFSSFLIVGLMVYGLILVMVNALPTAIGTGIANGSLEALLATRVKMPELMMGLLSYDLCWALLRSAVIVATGALLGMRFAWGHTLPAMLILALTLLAYLPFGLLAAASVLVFRTAGPFPQVVLMGSGLLGGVYFPTTVIPDLVKHLSKLIPLTYGLRAMRAVLLDGKSLHNVAPDIAALLGGTMLLMAVSLVVLSATLHYVRRGGGLSQY